MKRSLHNTVAYVAFTRVGMRKGITAMSFVIEWAMVTNSMGDTDITVDHFAQWWNLSKAQAYRRQATYREAFPEFHTPTLLLDALRQPVPTASVSEGVTFLTACEFAVAA